MNLKIKLLFFLIFSAFSIFGKNTNIDSLLSLLPKVKDTTKINILLEITNYHLSGGGIPKAKEFCEQAIEAAMPEKNVSFLANAFYKMGNIYIVTGNLSTALDYYLKSYSLLEKTSNKKLLYGVSNAIGNNYLAQKKFTKALEFYDRAFVIASELNDAYGRSILLIGKGNVYFEQKEYKKALDALSKAANGLDKTKFKNEYSIILGNIGNVYLAINENDKALKVFQYACQISQELDNKYGTGLNLTGIGTAYRKKNNIKMALVNYYKSMDIFMRSYAKYDLKDVYKEIAITYNKQNKNDSAFRYMQLYAAINDSIFSEENSKMIAQMQTKYESVKKEEENKALVARNELSDVKIQQQSRFQIGLLFFLGMIFIFAIFLYRSNKQKQKNNQIILIQKEKVEGQRMQLLIKNKEIVDSITYAKRLQEAILPPIEMLVKYLPESFIMYKPKDIVAGDFYWMEVVSPMLITGDFENPAEDNNNITSLSDKKLVLIAAADCTGHGVPGAIVSVVCSNALNRTVKEFGISDPGKILDKVRDLVVETFIRKNSNGEMNEVKDGMDISLISIEFGNGPGEKVVIKWAGANNSLWVIKNMKDQVFEERSTINSHLPDAGLQLIEIKANKQSIGKTESPTPFTSHCVELSKGDLIYLFTDGYADQFGGAKGKKFKYLQLKELLLANSHLSMQEQKRNLDRTIENWKGELEQVDDILIIGIRV